LSATFDASEADTDKTVVTEIGKVPGTPLQGANGNVDLLVRPDDLSLDATVSETNCTVEWVRYEGESRLYAVMLDSGDELKVRVSHENAIKPSTRAFVQLITTHPLAVFPKNV
jgi:iron(III) transport system ATP-binding protein